MSVNTAVRMAEAAAIGPVKVRGAKIYPDLYQNMPSRLVSLEEAREKGWAYFYQTESCRYGHQAPRYVSNTRQCVDCDRVKRGMPTIGASSSQGNFRKLAADSGEKADRVREECDAKERAFLEEYAKRRNLEEAAGHSKMTAAQVEARIAASSPFRAAVEALEGRLALKRGTVKAERFTWNSTKRDRLIETYVDTGDLASARDSISVTPSEYFRELARTEEFAVRVREAEPLAHRALEERAIQLALGGNDKLLQKVLAAKMPEQYRDSVKIDLTQRREGWNDDKERRLERLLAKLGGHGVIDVLPENRVAGVARGEAPAPGAQSNLAVLSG